MPASLFAILCATAQSVLGSSENICGAIDAKNGLCAARSGVVCTVASRLGRGPLKGKRGRSRPWSKVAADCSRSLRPKESRCPGGRKSGGVSRSVAERQLARASKEHARAKRDLKEFLSQKFRRQRRQAREIIKREVERLLAEHAEERCRLRLPPLSPQHQREAVIEGFRQRVVVPSDDGSMPWTDVQVLQDRLREADDALDRAQAEAALHKRSARLGRSM
jgi:hypothetical protein